jgi:hypothetical protein
MGWSRLPSHLCCPSVNTSCFLVSTCQSSPVATGLVLDVNGRQALQLVYHFNTILVLLLLLKSGKCGTSGLPFTSMASPAATRNLEAQHIQSKRNQKKVKTYSDWCESKKMKLESGIRRQLVLTLANFRRKVNW